MTRQIVAAIGSDAASARAQISALGPSLEGGPAPAIGEVLTWDGSAWVPAAGGGGGGVTSVGAAGPLASSGGLTPDISIVNGVSIGDIIRWSGTKWVVYSPTAPVTSVGAASPLASSGGTTPDISLNAGTNPNDVLTWDGAVWGSLPGPRSGIAQEKWVTKGGNDGTGNGSVSAPYASISAALTAITTASPTERWVIRVCSGDYTEVAALLLKPNVFILGESTESVRITAPSFGLAASWTVAGDNRSGFSGVTFASGAASFDFNAVTSDEGKLYFRSVVFVGTVSLNGHAAINQAQFWSCTFYAAFTISGVNVAAHLNNLHFSTIALNQHASIPTYLGATGGTGGTATVTAVLAAPVCQMWARSFFLDAALVANGAGASCFYTNDSVPVGGATGTGTKTLLNPSATLGANDTLSNLAYPTAVNQPILPATTRATNNGDWDKAWAYAFSECFVSTGSDLNLLSAGASWGADSTGRSIWIYTDFPGLGSGVDGGDIELWTQNSVSGGGIRGEIRLYGRQVDASDQPLLHRWESGITGSRPGALGVDNVGRAYLDTTLGQPLWWSGAAWNAAAITQLTGDVTAGPGTGSQAATVAALQGHSVSTTAPTSNQILQWISGTSKWTPTANGVGLGSKFLLVVEGGAYATIQDAINAAVDWDVILVGPKAAGASWGPVTLSPGKRLAIEGLGDKWSTQVKVDSITFNVSSGTILPNSVVVRGLYISGSFVGTQGVNFYGASPGRLHLQECYVYNTGATGSGVVSDNSNAASALYLDNCLVQSGSSGGIGLDHRQGYTDVRGDSEISRYQYPLQCAGGTVEVSDTILDGSGIANEVVHISGGLVTVGYSTIKNSTTNSSGVNLPTAGAAFGMGDATFAIATGTGFCVTGVPGAYFLYGHVSYSHSALVAYNVRVKTTGGITPVATTQAYTAV